MDATIVYISLSVIEDVERVANSCYSKKNHATQPSENIVAMMDHFQTCNGRPKCQLQHHPCFFQYSDSIKASLDSIVQNGDNVKGVLCFCGPKNQS